MRVLLALAVLFAATAVTPSPVQVPPDIKSRAPALHEIDRVTQLPAGIRQQLIMAEPGDKWNATDVYTPGLLGRRFIVAGCDDSLCAISYERGGIAYSRGAAVFKKSGDWKPVWNVSPQPNGAISDFKKLIAALQGTPGVTFYPSYL